MGVVGSAVGPSRAAGQRQAPSAATAPALVLCCYLLGAAAVTWRLWVDPAGRVQVGDLNDVDLFAWYLRYAATAVSHGRLPALVTTALNPPQGVNLMWNTSFLLPGIVLAPVTLLAGPQASLTVVLTLGLAGSAAALFWVLRRWGASIPAAALGGAVYGFSPALINSGMGHYHLVLAVLPPLLVHALLRLLTGRGNAVRTGAWLGLLAGAQVFTGEELLVYTAVTCLVLTLVLVAQRPRAALGRAGPVALGLAVAVAVALLICGHALWVQFRGPLAEHNALLSSWSSNPAYFVTPGGNLVFHTPGSAAAVAGFHLGPPEVLAYLGWPLIAVLVLAAICFWRDPRVRAAAVTFVVLELCSLGGGPQPHVSGRLLPWHWLQGLPALTSVLPDRFAIVADGAAAALLAFSLDLARSAARDRGWRAAGIPAAVAVLAVVPLIPLPYQAARLPAVPAGWQAAFARLRLGPDAPVLIVPVPNVWHTMAMRWQADTGEPGSMIGGYFLGPTPGTGQAAFGPGPAKQMAEGIDILWAGAGSVSRPALAQIRGALAYWRPAAVVAVTSPGAPVAGALIALLGRPSFRAGLVVAWRQRQRAG